jgi:hypothetical protein
VAKALQNASWISDISGSLSVIALTQYVRLWIRLSQVQLVPSQPDKFLWKWTSNQCFSSASAYRAFFHGQCSIPGASILCKAKAPPSCKFFVWLSLLGRCWTSERLERHGLPNNGPCALCGQASESICSPSDILRLQQGNLVPVVFNRSPAAGNSFAGLYIA